MDHPPLLRPPLRVQDLLADPILAGATVLAGRSGLDRPVTDLAWLADGLPPSCTDHLIVCDEASVTPAYRLEALVRRAETANAAALLVTAAEQPLLSTVRLADKLGIPVISVGGINLVNLLHQLTVRVRAPEVHRARLVMDVVRRLGVKVDAAGILDAVGQALSQPMWLLASDGTPIHGGPLELPATLRLGLVVPQESNPGPDGQLLLHPVAEPGTARAAAWLVSRVAGADEGRKSATASALAVAEPYVRAWLASRRAVAERDAAFHSRLLADLIADQDAVSQDVVERALSAGWRLQDWHVGIHVMRTNRGTNPAAEDPATATAKVRGALAAHQLTGPIVDRGDGWTAWVSRSAEPPPSDGRHVLRAVRMVLALLPAHWALAAGVGRAHQGPGGLAGTLLEARDAAMLAKTHEFKPAAEHIDELGVARLLAAWQGSEVLHAFAETALGPLRGVEDGQLLHTLYAYLECGGQVAATSKMLGLHRNTVAARLHRLRERLGVDLDDPNQRLALQLACRSLESGG